VASVFQILLLRECAAHFSGNELTFGFVLGAWLLWGGAGSLWASRREKKPPELARLFLLVIALSPVSFLGLRVMRPALGLAPAELLGPGLTLAATLVLTSFVSAPLGAAFAFVAKSDGPPSRVYLWESIGAASGGLAVYFLLIPAFSNASAAAIWGGATSLFFFIVVARGKKPIWTIAAVAATAVAVAAMAALAILDAPSQRLSWRPFELARTKDSRYGRLQVIRTAEQITFYDNGLRAFSYPDPAAAEEAVHFALLQRPAAGRVLLIGGGAGGSLAEILKYPKVRVDYVELDPAVIGLAEQTFPEPALAPLRDARVKVHFADGRSFVERTREVFDAILVDLPEPATAQVNRYFSLEFFRLVLSRLSPEGIYAFRTASAENYIGPALKSFLSGLAATLREVFPEVRVVPGSTNVFLASRESLTVDASGLAAEARKLGLRTATTTPAVLASRLDSLKVERLAEALAEKSVDLNTDLRPASYFYSAVLWSAQFRGIDSRLLNGLAGIPKRLLLDIPLAALALLLALLRFRSRKTGLVLGSLAIMGLTSLAVEVMVLVWFQSRFGVVYGKIALLLAVFMAGLAAGAFGILRLKRTRTAHLLGAQSVIIALLAVARLATGVRPTEYAFFAFLFALGAANGAFFVAAQSAFLPARSQAGHGYGWDLLGSFGGAVAVSAILIPLAGIPMLFTYLLLLNSLVFLALVTLRPRFS
jgi:spermidine synthase